jgi:imidazolonepropionase-like amidohydrolase
VRDIACQIRTSGVALSTRLVGLAGPERPPIRGIIHALADEGATLILGTEATLRSQIVPGVSVHDELRELVGAGLTPFQALRTATANPAIVLGEAGQFGIVAPGARADLLLLEANPLEDVGNTRRLAGLMVRGRWLGAADLQRIRDQQNVTGWRRVRIW